MNRVLLLASCLLLAACPQPANQQQNAEAPSAQQGGAGAGDERFYGRERFTLVGTQTGAESGAFTEHVRAWGRQRAEIKNTTLSMMGVTQRTNQRVVYTGAEVATINLDTGAVSIITNPLYDQIVDAMRGREGVEFGREIMTQMGGRATGERGAFAGHDCEYWEMAQLSSRSCVTPWGATLHNRTAIAGVTIERTVTEVRLNDGGPDAAFAFDRSAATQAPNLQDIMGKMKGD